jgi:threonylcarbamoyladenosine tRNA methylthiotransferase MtaB
VFGADLIAGFPTETDAMFANTLAIVEDAGLTHLHVFPYSIRPGTPAAKMPQVDGATIKARAATLRAAGDAAFARLLTQRVGQMANVLMEKPELGHSADYIPVRFADQQIPNTIVRARIAAAAPAHLMADTFS